MCDNMCESVTKTCEEKVLEGGLGRYGVAWTGRGPTYLNERAHISIIFSSQLLTHTMHTLLYLACLSACLAISLARRFVSITDPECRRPSQ